MPVDTETRVTDTVPHGCVLVSDADGDFVWASPDTESVFKKSPAEILDGETVTTLLGLPVRQQSAPDEHAVMERETVRIGENGQRKVVVTATMISRPDPITVYHCQSLENEHFSLSQVLSRVGDGIIAVDADWRYTYVNEHAEELLGYSSESLLGRVIWEVFPAAKDTEIQQALTVAMETQEPVTLEWYGPSVETWFEVRAFPSATGLSVYFTDITDRKDRESELRRERDLTENLLRVSPIGIAVHAPDRTFVRLNERAEEILGIASEKLLGEVLDESMWDAVRPDGSDFPDEEFPLNVVLRTGEATTGTEMWLKRADGTRIWLSVSAAPLLDENGGVERVVVTFEDVTERKERETELRQAQDLTEQLLRVSPIGICVLTPNGQFERVNERAEEILGVDREELLDESFREPTWEVRDSEGNELDDDEFPFAIALRTREPTFGHIQTLRRADGTRIWVSVSAAPLVDDGSVERVVVSFEDITERKEAEEELREREAMFRAVFEGTLDALILADDDGDYLEVNQAACDLYGLDEAALVGRNVAEFAPPGYDVGAAWDAFLEEGTLKGEFPLVRPDGEVRITDFVATANVRPGQHLSALRDVTERKENQERLATQRDELQRLNQINELIRDVNQVVVRATDRETIEEAVCTTLVDAENYPVAVTSRVTVDESLQIDHLAGLSAERFGELQAVGDEVLEAAIRKAAATNTPTIVREIQTDPDLPLEYDDTVYGVLSVAATDDEAFGEREQRVFAELGQLLGAAINAIQTRKLLHASSFHELELAITAETAPVLALNERVGGTWTLNGIVPLEPDRYLLYVDVGDAAPDEIVAASDEVPGIELVRVIHGGAVHTLEIRIGGDTPIDTIFRSGGLIREAVCYDGRGEFVVDVTLDTDVRSFLNRLTQRGMDVDLLAKRDVERNPAAQTVETSLTDRQRTVLEAAYRAGYFDWPRRHTTGEALADSLDISSSTLHQHLRVATQKLVEAYFGPLSVDQE